MTNIDIDTRTHSNTSLIAAIANEQLAAVVGGSWFGDAVDTVNNFGNGLVAGAVHGPNMKNDDTMAKGLDRNAAGTKAGVETGMMVNMALGPTGKLIGLGASAVQSAAHWVARQF